MHPLTWQAPRPVWRGTTPFAARPQILRFASDDFMEQLLATLDQEPARLSNRIAKPETWRTPLSETDTLDLIPHVPLPTPMKDAKRKRLFGSAPAAPPLPAPANEPLKLYQPAHQRYYVIAGTLACAIPGLPERAVAGGHEQVGFVVRRLLPATAATGDTSRVEYAYVKSGDEPRWQRVAGDSVLAPGEEMLPLFPLPHKDEEGRSRTLWGGLIPVGRREDYIGKGVSRTVVSLVAGQQAALRPMPPDPLPNSTQARTAQLRLEVMEPWKAMVRAAMKAADELAGTTPGDIEPEPAPDRARRVFDYNVQYQMQSWLLLLDLRKWIDTEIPVLGSAIASGIAPPNGTPARAVWNWLGDADSATLVTGIDHPSTAAQLKPMAASMRDALRDILQFEDALETATTQYTPDSAVLQTAGWPSFHFPLAGITAGFAAAGPFTDASTAGVVGDILNPPGTTSDEATGIDTPDDFVGSGFDPETLDKVTALFARALPLSNEADVQPMPHALKLRDTLIKTAGDTGIFVIRMVHLNADCGPLHPPTLSAASVRFRLASYFDPDAPVRPITITLPSDTSPAGLRKHGRGAAFVMSDMLCGQVQRAKGLGFIDLVLQVLPWPFHKDIKVGDGGGCKGGSGLEIGMICSLSIPIITLCALILLIIIVTLLDFIFRWLPWFIACFPVPKLKGKST